MKTICTPFPWQCIIGENRIGTFVNEDIVLTASHVCPKDVDSISCLENKGMATVFYRSKTYDMVLMKTDFKVSMFIKCDQIILKNFDTVECVSIKTLQESLNRNVQVEFYKQIDLESYYDSIGLKSHYLGLKDKPFIYKFDKMEGDFSCSGSPYLKNDKLVALLMASLPSTNKNEKKSYGFPIPKEILEKIK